MRAGSSLLPAALCYLLLLFVPVEISSGPSEGDKKIVSRTSKKLPKWITRPPSPKKGYVYFTGFYSKADKFSEAQTGALAEALSGVIDYLGVKMNINVKSEVKKSTSGGKATTQKEFLNTIEKKGGARLEGFEIEDKYISEYKIYRRGAWKNYHDSYLLLKYKKTYLTKEKTRLKRLYVERRNQALSAIKSGDALRRSDLASTIKNYVRAVGLAWETPGAEPVGQRAYSLLAEVFAGIKGKGYFSGRLDADGKPKTPVSVSYKYEGGKRASAIRGLDLKNWFEKGKGDVIPFSRTGQNGKARIVVTRVGADLGPKTLVVGLNVKNYLAGHVDEGHGARQKMVDLFSMLEVKIKFGKDKAGLRFGIVPRITSTYGRKIRSSELTGKLSDQIKKFGFAVVSPEKLTKLSRSVSSDRVLAAKLKKHIDFVMILDFEATKLGVTMGFYPIVLNGEARIIDVRSGETVGNFPLANQKGVASSYLAAEKKSLVKLGKSLSKALKVFLSKS